jgi:hypothetical protein
MFKHRAARRIIITAMMIGAVSGLASTAMAATAPAGAPNHALPSSSTYAQTTTVRGDAASGWQFVKQLGVTDRCGGANGWVQWNNNTSLPYIQTYGEVWTNAESCGGAGVHYVKLTFSQPFLSVWSSSADGQSAGPDETVGFNSGVIQTDSMANIGNIIVYLCSTEGTGNCNSSQSF